MKIQRLIRLTVIVISLLCIDCFLIPYNSYGILNIGNITGTVVFSLIVLYCLTYTGVNKLVLKLWERKPGKIFLRIAGGIVIVIVALVIVLSALMINACNKKPEGDETAIILGCGVLGEQPSLILCERMDAAYEYLMENPDAKCVLSGGQGPGENITEAECMYRYLTEKGIDEQRLYKEEKSTSTRENISFSMEVIKENGLNDDIVIVTNEFHEYRAIHIADKLEVNAKACPAKTIWWMFPTYYVRELYGILYEWIM